MKCHLTLFFSFGISLKEWDRLGILSREVRPYLELVKRGRGVRFITYGDKDDLQYSKKLEGIEIVPIFGHISKSSFRLVNLLKSLFFIWSYKKELRESDILKSNQMMGAWLVIWAKFLTGKKAVVRVGYELLEFYQNRPTGKFKIAFIYAVSKMCYRFADAIIVTTKKSSSFIQSRFSVNENMVFTHPNYIDIELFSSSSDKRTKSNILYVGRLDKHKNLLPVFEVARSLKMKLDLIGDGDEKESLKKSVESDGGDINFLGLIPNEKLPEYYKKYSFFILNSYSEGNPKVLLEAMSCGCCPIGNDVTGINDIIKDRVNGLLTDGSSESISSAVSEAVNDTELLNKISISARRYVEDNCSLDSLIKFELDIYEK